MLTTQAYGAEGLHFSAFILPAFAKPTIEYAVTVLNLCMHIWSKFTPALLTVSTLLYSIHLCLG